MKTALVVDDYGVLRRMICDLVASLGFKVREASGGREAIQIVSKSPERIDLLLTDIEMPGMDGLEVAQRVVKLKPDTAVVYMSAGRTESEVRVMPGVLSGSFFLQKPFDRDELEVLVSMVFPKARA